MPKKSFSAEQMVTLLRQIEVSMAQGKSVSVVCRDVGVGLARRLDGHLRSVMRRVIGMKLIHFRRIRENWISWSWTGSGSVWWLPNNAL